MSAMIDRTRKVEIGGNTYTVRALKVGERKAVGAILTRMQEASERVSGGAMSAVADALDVQMDLICACSDATKESLTNLYDDELAALFDAVNEVSLGVKRGQNGSHGSSHSGGQIEAQAGPK